VAWCAPVPVPFRLLSARFSGRSRAVRAREEKPVGQVQAARGRCGGDGDVGGGPVALVGGGGVLRVSVWVWVWGGDFLAISPLILMLLWAKIP